jgi:NAD-dependent dihydropyrimidine dehydrogenase PreA subunit
MKTLRYIKGVVTLKLDDAACIGCGLCTEVCPHGVLELKARRAAARDRDACMECGACARNCPVNAITVTAGTGCVAAIIKSTVTGAPPTCGCSCESDTQCC